MKLTDQEAYEAAGRLYSGSESARIREQPEEQFVLWVDAPQKVKDGYIQVVRALAGKLNIDSSPESIHVFMLWMGDALLTKGQSN